MLSTSQRLALLHSSVAICCVYLEVGISRALLLQIASCLGFLAIFFVVKAKEAEASGSTGGKNGTRDSGPDSFAIAITDVRRNPETSKVEYRLDGSYNGEHWTSWCRYSSLRQLKSRAGAKAEGQFPKKSSITQYFSGSDSTISFIDQRRKSLNRFLKDAIPDKDSFEILAQVPQVQSALQIPPTLEISSSGGKAKIEDVVKEALTALDMTQEICKHSDEGGDGWEFHSKSNDGIKCFLKKEGEFTYAMGKGPMDLEKMRALQFVTNLEHRKSWDDLWKFQNILETFQEYDPNFSYTAEEDPLNTGRSADWEILSLLIAHAGFSSPAKAIVAERDSVTVICVARRRSDGALFLVLRSVVDPRAPEGVDGYVRARVILGGFVFEDRKDGKDGCVMTSMGLVDPNGNIPQWLINSLAPQRAFVIRDINKQGLALG